MKLVIKFPTRTRPEKFKRTLNRYIEYLSGEHDVRFVISCDTDDETMNNEEMHNWFSDIKKNVDLDVFYGNSKTKVEAVNANLENEKGDVLLVASDDMNPVFEGYDKLIFDIFEQAFPNFDGAIKFHDGLRNDSLMTLPCLGWNLYEAIGHVYHPDYTSLYCDNEQTRLCAMLGKLVVSGACIARHEWVPGNHNAADKLHERNESFYDKDGAVMERRMKNNFDMNKVKERLDAKRSVSNKA